VGSAFLLSLRRIEQAAVRVHVVKNSPAQSFPSILLLDALVLGSNHRRALPSASSMISPSPYAPRLHFLRGEPPHDLLSLPMPLILRIVAAMAFSEYVGELSPPSAMANPA
jgi:hypothetical protein